ncbi:MAG TPA: DUF1501 domain-containing protein [Bacteroidota bacterium]|nr:DUF1501 domain-containing protein [Bacteroidota bacterium]
MNRRDFLRNTIPIPTLAFFLSGFSLKAYGRSKFLGTLVGAANATDRVLVLIQLNGGNDGLNTVIPLDQYSGLSSARSNILIEESKVLKLTSATGLHPLMPGLQELYKEGKLAVLQSVGYPNPNFSHFRSTDIWLTGSDSDQVLNTGWMGRYLYEEFTDYPNGYPNEIMPDPLAIQIGSVVSLGFQGPSVSTGIAITSPTSFYNLVTGGVDTAPNTPAGHELTFIRQVAQQTQQYASVITTAANKATNKSLLYPLSGQNTLADQLKIVAQLIAGGLKTRIYVVNIGGFDTHSSQVDSTGGTDSGLHATLLSRLSVAINAFQDDLELLGVSNRVVGMTFSEFGRRIISNASLGTDHGAAAPLFVFGTSIKPGVYGSNPVIPSNPSVNDNIPMQYDFRSVYASILKSWFNVSQTDLETILLRNFQTLPLIKQKGRQASKGPYSFKDSPLPNSPSLNQNYPNPFNPLTHITFSSNGDPVQIRVFDTLGREIRTLVEEIFSPGEHSVVFNAEDLPAGIYYYRMQSGSFQQIRSMQLVK